MNTKTTLVLAVLAVAVVACLFFVVKPWEDRVVVPGDEEPKSTAKALFDPKPADVDRVEVSLRDEPTAQVFKKDADGWTMLSPTTCPAVEVETFDRLIGGK